MSSPDLPALPQINTDDLIAKWFGDRADTIRKRLEKGERPVEIRWPIPYRNRSFETALHRILTEMAITIAENHEGFKWEIITPDERPEEIKDPAYVLSFF